MNEQEVQFDPLAHVYTAKGKQRPSVTQVLKGCGLIETSFYKPTDAQRGTNVHLACQLWDEGDLDAASLDPAIIPYLDAWRSWVEGPGKVKILHIEKKFFHDLYGYCGTIDRILEYRDKLWVLDIKTGVTARWHRYQLAGYALGATAARLGTDLRRGALYLSPEGKATFRQFTETGDFTVFMAALTIARAKEEE